MITDLQGAILHVNQALEDLTGYQRDELRNQTPRLFKSGLHPPELYSAMWRGILARQSWQGELTNRRKNGTLFDASLTISPIVDLSERAALLTRQLLAFARKPALTRRPTAMPDLVRATADLVVRSLHQDVEVEAANTDRFGAPFIVEADANQLQQALINLALN